MAQVSNETEFRSALNRLEPLIEITADFSLTAQILISYSVTVKSSGSQNTFTLTGAKASGGYLFHIDGGSLTLQNIIINGGGSPLLFAAGGGLVLDEGALLKNTSMVNGQKQESADEIYIADRDSVLRIKAPLSPGMLLQVDASDYVSPNPEGKPILIGTACDTLLSGIDAKAFQKPETGFDGWEIRLSDDRRQILLAPQIYSITYDDPLNAFHPNPQTYTITDGKLQLQPPENPQGYQFAGWYDRPDGGRPVTSVPENSTGDITLYARWMVSESFTVTFDANSGSSFPRVWQMPRDIAVAPQGSFIIPSFTPKRTCYRFIEWNTSPDGRGLRCLPGEVITDVNRSFTLYAIWRLGWSWELI